MKTILLLTDFTKKADHAAEFAMAIAVKSNAEVMLFNTFPVPQVFPSEAGVYPYSEDYGDLLENNNHRLESLTEKLKKSFEVVGRKAPEINFLSVPGDLAENIHDLQEKKSIWMIVMGDKGKETALSRFLLGSESLAVIDKATCPVLLVPEMAELKPLKKMLFGTELQQTERKAVSFMAKLAADWQAGITVVHVSMKQLTTEEEEEHQKYYNKLISGLDYADINYLGVKGEDTKEALTKFASGEVIDLIALVHKKRSLLGEFLHGSISKEMLNYHHVPLLVLHKD